MPVESTKTEQVSTPATSNGCAVVAESVPPLAPESEVIDMTIDSGDEYMGDSVPQKKDEHGTILTESGKIKERWKQNLINSSMQKTRENN